MNVLESETLEQLTNVQFNDFDRADNSKRQNQVIGNKMDDHITRADSRALMTVKNCMHDAILTAIVNLVIARVEMAVKSITDSTGLGTSSEFQKTDRRYFLGKKVNNPLMSASGWLDLDNELNRNDETRNDEEFKDGDFPAIMTGESMLIALTSQKQVISNFFSRK